MPGLVPGIHVFLAKSKAWMAGTSPAMTTEVIPRGRGALIGPHLIACGLIGEPVPPVMISGGPQKKNS